MQRPAGAPSIFDWDVAAAAHAAAEQAEAQAARKAKRREEPPAPPPLNRAMQVGCRRAAWPAPSDALPLPGTAEEAALLAVRAGVGGAADGQGGNPQLCCSSTEPAGSLGCSRWGCNPLRCYQSHESEGRRILGSERNIPALILWRWGALA